MGRIHVIHVQAKHFHLVFFASGFNFDPGSLKVFFIILGAKDKEMPTVN